MKNQPSPLTPKKRTRLSPVPTGSVKKARYVKKSSNSDTGSPTVSSDDGSGSVEQHRRLKRPAPLTPRKSLETLNQFSKLHIATPSSSRFVQHSPGIQASYTALEIDEHLGMEQDSEADDAEEQEVSNTVLDAFPESDAEVRSDTEPVRDVRQVIKEYIYPPPLRRFKLGMIDGEEYGPEQSWMEGETVNEEDHGSDKPVRILDQFIFYLDSCMQLCALGEVSPKIDEDELGDIGSEVDDVQEPSLIYLGPVVDAYQGGSAASTSIWVETDLAWYILGVSHPLYRETYKPFFIAHTFTLIFSHLANDKPMASPEQVHALIQNPHGIYNAILRNAGQNLKCKLGLVDFWSNIGGLVEGMVQEHEGAPCNVALPKTHSVEGPGGTTAYTSIKINGVKYQRGDVVLVMPGEDEQTKRQLQALDASAMSKNELANAFWLISLIMVSNLQLSKIQQHSSAEKGAFLDVAPHRSLSLAIEAADCYPCLLKAEQQLLSTPRLLDGPVILLEGGTYHLQELVYIKPDSPGPYILAQIQSVAQRKDKIRIQVSLLQRSAPDSRKFHDDPQNSKQLDSWLELPNHFWLESLGLDQTTCNQCLQDEMDILNKKIKPMKQHPLKALDIFSGCGGLDEVDIIYGGPPCQSFSLANAVKKDDDPRHSLALTALSFVDLYRPSYVILENVRGMVDYPLVNLDGEIMEMGIPKLWLRCLTAMDYQVHLSVLESGAYGTPQCRARLIIIASKRDGASVVSPSSLFAPLPPITVDMAISDLPQFNWYESGPSEPFSPVFTPEHGWGCQVPYKTHVQTRYQYSLRNPVGRVQQHFTKIYSAIISNRVRHIPLRPGASWKDLPANLQEKVWRIKALNKTAYKRVIGEDFFPTSVCKVDPTSRFGQVLHPTQRRVISLREYARAQGFPDTFIFWTAGSEDTIQELFKQIGNAVPIPLGIALGQAIMFALVSN
ncbi:hypothetical protein FRC01_001269 [Tulasnella sp. 417]|nr:hypothetical protein FRC01_001269 [Tulasnella sp. 417]